MLILCTRLKPTLLRLSFNHCLRPKTRNFSPSEPHLKQLVGCGYLLKARNGLTILKTPRLQLLRFVRTDIVGKTKVPKVKIKRSELRRLLSLARDEKLVLFAAMGCLLISSAITMSVPFALGKIIDIIFNDSGTTEDMLAKLKLISLGLCGIFIIGGLANAARVYFFNSASLRIVQNLRSRTYKRILLQETSWFDTKGSGELVNRLINDTYFVANSLSQNLSDGMRSLVMIGAGTGMMVYTSPQLALISTCIVPAMAGFAVFYGRFVRNVMRKFLDKFANISKHAEERFGNIKTVKTFCKENEEGKSFDLLLDDAIKLGYQEVMARSIFFGLTGFSGNVIVLSVLFYGGSLVVSQELTIGALTTFMLYAGYSAVAINGLSNFYTELNKGLGAAQRLWEIYDRDYAIPLNVGITPPTSPRGEIKFENVHFNFPARPDSPVLKNFNLTLLPGQTTAVVGRSGSGKTTIATLMLRLYDPQSGTVYLDGVDMRKINPTYLRKHISAVSQEPVLFSGTIRDNILYGLNADDKVNTAILDEVVRKAHIDEFASTLKDGLNTAVGQRGIMLSGGQKQRVAIARALIKNPTILILDEATSALDSVSEELVQNALELLIKGRTVLTIAHRLSTIRNADKIAVLENGIISEEGPYDLLISNEQGIFKDLVSKQAFITKQRMQIAKVN